MGVAATIGATLLGGYLTGRAARQQAEAQARQAETQAQVAYNNAEKLDRQAEQEARNNAINEENKRRRLQMLQGQQRANIGAAGITASGSALGMMADSAFNTEQELAVDRYNARQKVDNIFQASTDNLNQGDIYKRNAADYRRAGKRAMVNSMLQAGLSLAGNLYSSKSQGAKEAGIGASKNYQGTWGPSGYTNYKGGYLISDDDYKVGVKNRYGW